MSSLTVCVSEESTNNGIFEGDYRYDALKQLTRARYRTVIALSKEKQRFANLLFIKCSSLTQEKVFSNTFGATVLSLYEDFETIDDTITMDLDNLVEYIVTKGKNHSWILNVSPRLFKPPPEAPTACLKRLVIL